MWWEKKPNQQGLQCATGSSVGIYTGCIPNHTSPLFRSSFGNLSRVHCQFLCRHDHCRWLSKDVMITKFAFFFLLLPTTDIWEIYCNEENVYVLMAGGGGGRGGGVIIIPSGRRIRSFFMVMMMMLLLAQLVQQLLLLLLLHMMIHEICKEAKWIYIYILNESSWEMVGFFVCLWVPWPLGVKKKLRK